MNEPKITELLEQYRRCSWSAKGLLEIIAKKLAAKNAGADLHTEVMAEVSVIELVDEDLASGEHGSFSVACMVKLERRPRALTRSEVRPRSGRRRRLPSNVIAFPGRRT